MSPSPYTGLGAVAPHTGAWIETASDLAKTQMYGSHPTRVRGLKLCFRRYLRRRLKSHPTRVRGLKLGYGQTRMYLIVAPHTGAWIETKI